MTILEALKSMASYPIKDDTAERILVKRGLAGISDFDQAVSVGKAFELCEADLYTFLVSGANISEGGYSVSMADKSYLMKLASAIYSKHGESNPFAVNITDASSRW